MGITVGHPKSITIADGTNSNIVLPSDWNSAHAVTLSLANNEVIKYIQAGTNSVSSGVVSFGDGNGISFGMGTNGVITGTVKTDYQSAGAYLTTAQPVGAYLTTAAQSNHSHAFATTTTNGASIVVGTSNSNGVTIGVPAYLTTTAAQSVQPVAYAVGGTTNNFSTLAFANSNGLSWSTGTQGVFPGTAVLTTAAQSNHSHAFATTTTNGASIVVGTSNSNGYTIGVPAYLTTAQPAGAYLTTAALSNHSHGVTLNLTNINGTTGGNSAGIQLSLSAAGGGTVNQTGPNIAAGGVTVTDGTVVFSNANGVSFGIAGSTLTASAAGGAVDNWYMPFPKGNNTSFSVMGQSSIYLQNFVPPNSVAVSNVEMPVLYSYATSATPACTANMSVFYGLYGKGTGTQANSLALIGSSSMSLQASYNSSTTGGFTIGNSVTNFNSGTNGGSALFASLSGPKILYLPFTTTMQPNSEYYWAMNAISNTSGNTGPLRLNFLIQTNMNSTVWGKLKVDAVSGSGTNYFEEFDGLMYNAQSANLPALLATSGLQLMASQGRFWMIFENE